MKVKYLALALVLLLGFNISASAKKVFGVNEHVYFPQLGIKLPAKMDTGADTSSLSAQDISVVKVKGKRMVRFELSMENGATKKFELPLKRFVRIRPRIGDIPDLGDQDIEEIKMMSRNASKRPVVELTMTIHSLTRDIEINLVDRSHFKYPVLVGSSAIVQFGAVIDPSIAFKKIPKEIAKLSRKK